MATSFSGLLFLQDRCEPCVRTKQALSDAFDQSEHIKLIPFKDDAGLKTDIARDYGIEVTPTLILVRPDGLRSIDSRGVRIFLLSSLARLLGS